MAPHLSKNQRKRRNASLKKEEELLAFLKEVKRTRDEYQHELCFLSAYGLDARPSWLPIEFMPAWLVSKL